MSYLARLSTRAAPPPASGEHAALRPAIRSQSPIAEIDQRVGVAGEAFDHVPVAFGDESSESAQAEFSTPTKPAPGKAHTSPTGDDVTDTDAYPESLADEASTQPALLRDPTAEQAPTQRVLEPDPTAGQSGLDIKISTPQRVDKVSEKRTDQPAASLSALQPSASGDTPSSITEPLRPETDVAPRQHRLPQGSPAPEPTAPVDSIDGETSGANQSPTKTLAPDISPELTNFVVTSSPRRADAEGLPVTRTLLPVTQDQTGKSAHPTGKVVPVERLVPEFESQSPPTSDLNEEAQQRAPLEPKAPPEHASVASGPLSDLRDTPPPRVIIDQLTVEVIPPSGPASQNGNQPKPNSQKTNNRSRAPVSLIGPLGSSVSAQVRFGVRHR